MKFSRSIGWISLCILFVAVFIIWSVALGAERSGELRVSYLDVGQGDAVFIESPTGVQVLIDGGPDRSVLRALSREMHWFDRSIDVVIATHPDSDHVSGLVDVLERYDVGRIFFSNVEHDTPAASAFDEAAAREGSEVVDARRGQVIDLGGGAIITMLFPDRDVSGMESNAASVIVRLTYGDTSFLFTGDSPAAIEKYLVFLDGVHLESDVLKVGHHGSNTSSDELFVGFVQARYAVISRGCDNRYGHPHEEVLVTLAQFEVEILDTCEEGTVTFVSSGKNISVQ